MKLKSFLEHDIPIELDLDSLDEFLSFRGILSNKTLLNNIKLLPPGANILFDVKKNNLRLEKYYEISEAHAQNKIKSQELL